MNEIFEDLEFCIEQLGLNDEETEEIVNITENLGIRPEYFADEFVFFDTRQRSGNSTLFAFAFAGHVLVSRMMALTSGLCA